MRPSSWTVSIAAVLVAAVVVVGVAWPHDYVGEKHLVNAQGATATPTPTPNPCPDSSPCHKKRYAHRTQWAGEAESVQGIFGVAGAPSIPCVIEPQTNYSLWVVADTLNNEGQTVVDEFVEIGTIVQPDGSRYIFSGCTICDEGSFWGNHGRLPFNGPTSLRIERHPNGTDVNGCWKWFVNDDKVRDSCENGHLIGDVLSGGDRALVGGETDSYFNDMGVQDYSEMAVKLTASAAPLFEDYSPINSQYYIYTHGNRYASSWEDQTLQMVSDTHFSDEVSFCDSGR